MRRLRAVSFVAGCFMIALFGRNAAAQRGPAGGSLRGTITDTSHAPVARATVHVAGTALGGVSDATGAYLVDGVPAGRYSVVVRRAGFTADSSIVTIRDGETVTRDIVLHVSTQQLDRVIISASPRLNETIEQALAKQKNRRQHRDGPVGRRHSGAPERQCRRGRGANSGRLDGAR